MTSVLRSQSLQASGRAEGLRICLSCIELFGVGIYGGFGRATRMIGRELVKRGASVTIVVPKRAASTEIPLELDGMSIRHFDPRQPWSALEAYRACDADIYHSQDTWLGTWLAMKAMPHRSHIITFRDPLDRHDWKIETELSGQPFVPFLGYRFSIDNPLVSRSVRKADALYAAAHFVIGKVSKKYSLSSPPKFLPTPVQVPAKVAKAQRPTVCFVGRLDPRKRPEMFFDLARRFPQADFIAVGGSSDVIRHEKLKLIASEIPNLQLTGPVDQFRSTTVSEVLSKSWIIVNTSAREGLPTTFVEAAVHRCAILSISNPDEFASRFGYHARDEDLDKGLSHLLDKDNWRFKGESAHEFAAPIFGIEPALDAHLAAYDAMHVRQRRPRKVMSHQVSVVIPTRNRRRLLEQSIASVQSQRGVDIDLIVVDDASEDDTWSFLQSLSGLRAVRNDVRSERSRARNTGLSMARAPYVMFLDDDDVLRPNALSILARALDANPDAIASAGARYDWFEDEGWGRRDIHPRIARTRNMFDELLFGWSAIPSQTLYRTEAVRSVGGFNPTVSYVEDRDLWLRIARNGPVALRPETVMTYRITRQQDRPADIIERRNGVARRGIRELPKSVRRHGLIIRRCGVLLNEADDLARARDFAGAIAKLGRAFAMAPRFMMKPLIASYVFTRMGRATVRAFIAPPSIATDERTSKQFITLNR